MELRHVEAAAHGCAERMKRTIRQVIDLVSSSRSRPEVID